MKSIRSALVVRIAEIEMQSVWIYESISLAMNRYTKYRLSRETSPMYLSPEISLRENRLKVVTKFPNSSSMRGSGMPAPMAAVNAMTLSVQLFRSA